MQKNQRHAVAHLFSGGSLPTRLRNGHRVAIRVATSDDAGMLAAMHARCSGDTVYRRYHSIPSMTGRFLSHILGTDITLVAEIPNRSLIALANVGRDDHGSGELAVLVEDGWQGRGLGAALLRNVVMMARLTGYSEVYATCLSDSGWIERALGRLGPVQIDRTAGQVSMRVPLGAPNVTGRRTVPDLVPAG